MKPTVIHTKVFIILISLSVFNCVGGQDGVIYSTTVLDGNQIRSFYRSLRDFGMWMIGQTAQRSQGSYLEGVKGDFPCNLTNMRSPTIPTSVHRLRPGDIDVIAALGDSLTAGSGAISSRPVDLFIENRGLSWSIGGQWDWRNATTLPNILKVYNPDLLGYSKQDSWTYHRESQFNMAEIGASSADMPYMAKKLVERIKGDRRINFKKSWKMVTIAIGGNDICSFVCMMKEPETLPRKYEQRLIKTLRYLRDNLPRTFVNLVPVPSVKTVVMAEQKPNKCQFLHHGECACWIGHLYNQNKQTQEFYDKMQREMHQIDEEVAVMKEFSNLDEFAVVFQPWSLGISFETEKTKYDLSLLAYDCFHMSQKGHGWAGVSLWNNLLEPPHNKSMNWMSPQKRFLCPSEKHPYLFTNNNQKDESNESPGNLISYTHR